MKNLLKLLFKRLQKDTDWKYEATITRAINNIVTNINDIHDSYSLAVVAYALQLANHPIKDQVLESLIGKSTLEGNWKLLRTQKL